MEFTIRLVGDTDQHEKVMKAIVHRFNNEGGVETLQVNVMETFKDDPPGYVGVLRAEETEKGHYEAIVEMFD